MKTAFAALLRQNFVLVDDPNQHVCEAQLVHKKMKLQRTEQDGHAYYGRVRVATEVLEKLRLLAKSERPQRIKELRLEGTTAATLKHIGGVQRTARTQLTHTDSPCLRAPHSAPVGPAARRVRKTGIAGDWLRAG